MSTSRSPTDSLRDLLFKLPGGTGTEITRDMEGIERIRDAPAQGGKRPEQMSPQELHAVLWQVLSFRDSGVFVVSVSRCNIQPIFQCQRKSRKRSVGRESLSSQRQTNQICVERIPGLESLVEKISESISGK